MEASTLVEWSTGFREGFDALIKMAKDKFLDVDLSGLKLEDYCSLVGSEVGTPLVEEVRVALKEASVPVVVPAEVGERLIPWRSNRFYCLATLSTILLS